MDIKGIHIYSIRYSFKVSRTPINLLWYKRMGIMVDNEKTGIINGHIPVSCIADCAPSFSLGVVNIENRIL